MNHTVSIKLRGRGRPPGPIIECQTRPVSAWLWRLLFGKRHSVAVLMPGGSVDAINVSEQAEGVKA